MYFEPLAFDSALESYAAQAQDLLEGHRAGDPEAIKVIHHHHPRFLDDTVKWLPRTISDSEIADAAFDLDDARLTVARSYSFRDWSALATWVADFHARSSTYRFECAAEAMITGDHAALDKLLRSDPALIAARSTRVTTFDPPEHHATLLHYVAANGIESHRQKSSPNVPAIAKTLLEAGAEPDALADMYGARCTTMSMLVSSSSPAEAGVQVALIDVLADYGASVESVGAGNWASPLRTALVFGFRDAAQVLIRRGATVNDIVVAAGLGLVGETKHMLPLSDASMRHCALALAAQLGHVEIVQTLLDAGEDPDRYNPPGFHGHATPLHQAALAGHESVVRYLLDHGARLDIKDRIYRSTPQGWAQYAGNTAIAELLASAARQS